MIYPLLLFGEGKLHAGYELTDYYHLATEGEYHQYLFDTHFFSEATYSDADKQLKAAYHNYNLRGRYSLYPNVTDCIELNLPEEYLGLAMGFKYAEISFVPSVRLGEQMGFGAELSTTYKAVDYTLTASTRQGKADISYNIGKESGSIPFAWNHGMAKMELSSKHYAAMLSLDAISPLSCDSLYSNSLNADLLQSSFVYKFNPRLSAKLMAGYLDSTADLRYKGGLYGSIEKLRVLHISTSVQKDFPHLSYRMGFSTYFSGIGSDSYLDIWPFTFLDTFLSHRTRIKQLGVEVYSPEAELSYKAKDKPGAGFNWQASLAYHHLFHHENVVLKNRVAVIYPFLFTYTTNHYNWQDELDAYLNIPLSASYAMGKATVQLNLKQLVPLKWSKVTPSSNPSTEPSESLRKSQWGGLSASVDFSYNL